MISPYETYNALIGVKLSFIVKDEDKRDTHSLDLLSYSAYEKRVRRDKKLKLRSGKGLNNCVLLNWSYLPNCWKEKFKEEFGSPVLNTNPLAEYFSINPDAKRWFAKYEIAPGEFLAPEQQEQYTINASVLDALELLKNARETSRKMRGTSLRGLWPSLREDVKRFNENLIQIHGIKHNLPTSRKLKPTLENYQENEFISIIDGRAKNQSAQVVSDKMIDIWKNIFAGQRDYKPDYAEVHKRYLSFLAGMIDIINADTGEIYDRKDPDFVKVSRQTVYKYQSSWEHRLPSHAKRSGDRQVFQTKNIPFHKLRKVKLSGTLISVDDRQPPFKNLKGNRIWFYNAIDLGSEAFTTWVYGDTKEGIILEFYRSMVRNYVEWNMKLPLGLECESSLNSSYKDTFLSPGAMFQDVRIEANNARGKRIEAYYRNLRYQYEKKREGWLARPHAKLESNQQSGHKVPQLPTERIVQECLMDIAKWNNSLHSNQELYPGLTRWDVFIDHQNPVLDKYDYNWDAILRGLGYSTQTSMNAGRIILQGMHRVVGHNGHVATSAALINIMKQIEGQKVEVRWLDDNKGHVLKALVYKNDVLVCELLDDLEYSRSAHEMTEDDLERRKLSHAYRSTVEQFIKDGKQSISNITIIENEAPAPQGNRFVMPGLKTYIPNDQPAEALPTPNENEFENEHQEQLTSRVSTASRF